MHSQQMPFLAQEYVQLHDAVFASTVHDLMMSSIRRVLGQRERPQISTTP